MRRNNMPKIMAFLLALALVSTSMLSGTFAKYSSEFSGQDTALVARWDFHAIAGQPADLAKDDDSVYLSSDSEAKRLNLFGHEYNKHIVTSDGGIFIIAPGVESMFFLALANFSDVSAKVEISFELVSESAVIPLKYNVGVDFYMEEIDDDTEKLVIVHSEDWVELEDLSTEVLDRIASKYSGETGLVEVVDGDVIMLPHEAPEDDDGDQEIVLIPISWRWPFEVGEDDAAIKANDKIDTDLGIASASGDDRTKYELLITVKATQVEPE